MVFRDYELPVALSPGRQYSAHAYVAEVAIKQGQLVKAGTDDDEVTPSDTDGEPVTGFAAYSAAAGDTILVLEGGGRARATSGTGDVTSGDLIASGGGSGENGEVQTASAGDYVVGRAFRDDSGDGGDAPIQIEHIGVAEESA
ncbi:hypothetical protein HALLA_12065 [Halostagnicola larsenii XH-48]|uniref:DUF2190 domain-containing protein n=1 Tax=Halostagnicola larsenii XH-48 TaxID=797299 RepID=W0JUN2_9EURY|nr:hypothetical protein [Halostagnicola larsenii]AHG00911.1 hypothetical protein HALLA_11765 [Halostagnicola larsenii XH-48]AHG00960.1 hypothetical protein HALLA_12065 [Halostagnicola larsenii XH-48]